MAFSKSSSVSIGFALQGKTEQIEKPNVEKYEKDYEISK